MAVSSYGSENRGVDAKQTERMIFSRSGELVGSRASSHTEGLVLFTWAAQTLQEAPRLQPETLQKAAHEADAMVASEEGSSRNACVRTHWQSLLGL